MRLSDLQTKEIINMTTGKRLGLIIDVIINAEGNIKSLILEEKKMNDEEYMEIAYQEALKALKHDDVPIGCIIVKDDQIIARAYNQSCLLYTSDAADEL